MNRTPSSNHKARAFLLLLAALLLLTSLTSTFPPVRAQSPFELNYAFDYSPLVSGAPNSLHVLIQNTALTPIRIVSVGLGFSWMKSSAYISTNSSQTPQNLAPEQQVQFSIPFEISDNVTTGAYSTVTFVAYQIFQGNGWGGPQAVAYTGGVSVLGGSSPYSITFDPYEGRFYEALAILTLLGWYLPKLRYRVRG